MLQEQQFERVGESKTRRVDVRIITATNRNLKEQVQRGQFREDLYFRLNVFPIESVPLRERSEDIPLLTQHFLKKSCTRINKQGLKISLSELEKLKDYHWPGNIRELENVIERQVILAQGSTLRFSELLAKDQQNIARVGEEPDSSVLTASDLKQQERRNLLMALEKCHGKVFGHNGAAQLLGIKPTTLASRIKKYQIDTRLFKQSSAKH